MPAEVLDLEGERLAKTCSEMDDETLLFCMLGTLQLEDLSGTAGVCARTAFTEIASRWVPLKPFAAAFLQLENGSDDA